MNFKSVFAKGFTLAVITGFLAVNVQAQEPAKKDTSKMHKMDKMHKMEKMDKKMGHLMHNRCMRSYIDVSCVL